MTENIYSREPGGQGRWSFDYHAAMKRNVLIVALCVSLSLHAQQRPEWRDTFESRLEIQALLQTLNGEILAGSSATRTLETWCDEHHMADDPKIVAIRMAGARKEPSAEQLQRLGVRDASEVRYRRVELRCGAHVFSVADNWYVPERLTPEMNAQLDTTDTPFGKVVQPLHPYRRTVAATPLWTPLPRGWEQRRSRFHLHPERTLAIPKDVFEHRAVLYTADHLPFSEVVETYQSEVLAFRR
jgi:chorismate-pyruvate lyase